ncbi:MAG: ASKHA domain-containing protein [Deltaproteobacteria bacterium]|nr:ASKHA domain-containing protein [Deltaproteobacteria bacterium]
MKTHTVHFLPADISVEVEEDATIAEAAQRVDVFINNLCGGEGVCGRCRVQVLRGRAEAEEHAKSFFSPDEITKGYVLACQTRIHDDLEVVIPPESRMEDSKIMIGGATQETGMMELRPIVKKIYLELPPPTSEDNVPDIERISRELRKQFGWHAFDISLDCLQNLSDKLRQNDWKITVTLARKGDGYRILKIDPLDTSQANYGVAVDVGTTTVVVQLVDLNTGRLIGSEGCHNQQASYGEDVISRVIFACGKGGLEPVQKAVIKNINQLIRKVCKEKDVPIDDINAIVAAGNTTMSHFLLGLSPCSIRLDPYVPTADEFPLIHAEEVGIQINPRGILQTIPCVASYVGGDIVAGVMSCGIPEHEEVRGLIDIGTNGEIAIGNKDWLICCSASAGPAFEGGGTRCGMRAIKGAIEKIAISEGELHYQTIEGAKPRGICGSGLIDCIYELVKNGIIDPSGKFHRDRKDDRLRIEENVPEYIIAFPEETESGTAVTIAESDIDNLIKSKGAVFAAIKSLTDYIGLGFDMIETFYVAGGFGSFMDISKSIAIGLLPDIPREKIQFIGNSSLTGARMSLLSESAMETCINISRSMTNIELSTYQPFTDEYIAALFLPHTNRKLFPSVAY